MKSYEFSETERKLLEELPVAMCVFQRVGWKYHVLLVSDGYCQLLKLPRKSMRVTESGMDIMVYEEDMATLENMLSYVELHPDAVYPVRLRVRGADNRCLHLRFTGKPREPQNGVRLVYVSCVDVSAEEDMHRAQSRARERSDLLLEKVLSTTEAAIFWKDADRRFIGANRAFLDYYGFPSVQSILGKTDEDLGWNIEVDKFRDDEKKVLEGVSTYREFGHCIRKGEVRDIVASKAPLYEDGKIVGLVGSFEDVTQERRQQNENGRLTHILENVPAGLCMYQLFSGEFVCVFVNRYFTTMTGIPMEALGGEPVDAIHLFLEPEDREWLRKTLVEMDKSKRDETDGILHIRKKSGTGFGSFYVIVRRVIYAAGVRYYVSYTDVTEEKEMERKQKAERRVLKRVLEKAHILVWEYNPETHKANFIKTAHFDSAMKIHGLDGDSVKVPESLINSIAPNDRKRYIEFYRAVQNGTSGSIDVELRIPDETEKRYERITYLVSHDADGKPVQWYGMSQNITAELRLIENYNREKMMLRKTSPENLFAKSRYNLTDNRMLVFWVKDNAKDVEITPDMNYDTVLEAMMESAMDDAERQKIKETLGRENVIRRHRDGEQTLSVEFKRKTLSNRLSWALATVNTFTLSDGSIEAFTYGYDITESVLSQKIMTLLEELDFDLIGVIDTESGRYFMHDTVAHPDESVRMWGGDLNEHVAENVRGHVPEAEINEALEAMSPEHVRSELRQNGSYEYAMNFEKDGQIHRKLVRFCYLDSKHNYVFLCRQDITKEYRRELERVQKLNAALQSAHQADEAKTMFLAGISHDMRTPLNGIIGFTRLALKTENMEHRLDYLKKIDSSGKLLLSFVNDVLELLRLDSGKNTMHPEEILLNSLIDEVVVPVRVSAEQKSVHFVTDIPQGMNVSAFVDKLKMQEVMLNLLSNAVKFTPEQGTVMFLFEILEEPIQGCNTRIVVQDTGIGVGHEFISKMFEPFMQEHNALTKNISGGTGLGLSIVKRIVDHMKGFIEVESEQGLGTKFTVLLPIEYREADVQDNVIRIEDVEFKGQRLLLCEDNMLNMEIAKTLLEDKGFIVDCAEDGVEGLQKYKEAGPDAYAGILMDIRMPRMNGYEAVECIRALDREDAKKVPIIAMTADAYPEDIQHCHDAGMNAHIAKPIDQEDMFRVLAKWCAK